MHRLLFMIVGTLHEQKWTHNNLHLQLLNLIDSSSCVTQTANWASAPSCLNNAKHLMACLLLPACQNPKSFFSPKNFSHIHPIGHLHPGCPNHSIRLQFNSFQLVTVLWLLSTICSLILAEKLIHCHCPPPVLSGSQCSSTFPQILPFLVIRWCL